MPNRSLLISAVGALGLACATTAPAPVPSQSGSTFSAASAYSTVSYEPLPVAAASPGPGELLVRPDRVVQAFAIRVRKGDAKAHFAALEEAVGLLQTRFGEATSGQGKVNVLGLRLEQRGGKVKDGGLWAVLDGELVLALGGDETVWERGRGLFAMQELAAQVAESGLAKDDARDFSFSAPVPEVTDPEAHRQALLDAWTARVRPFLQAAGTAQAPLSVVDCRALPLIRQRPISIERVALGLEPQCRIDVAPVR